LLVLGEKIYVAKRANEGHMAFSERKQQFGNSQDALRFVSKTFIPLKFSAKPS